MDFSKPFTKKEWLDAGPAFQTDPKQRSMNMAEIRLKQRKTKLVSGWLTRDDDGWITLWKPTVARSDIHKALCGDYQVDGVDQFKADKYVEKCMDESYFMSLYTGIPRKGRAVFVKDMEIVV